MTLPYPYEVETGVLGDRPAPKRGQSLELAGRIARAVHTEGDRLRVFGQLVATDLPIERACSELRRHLIRRFQERQPFAEERQWRHFELLMQKQLERSSGLQLPDVLHTAIITIDGM